MTTPTSALVEEAPSMTTDTLIEEAMGEMHRLGIDNLRAKGAIILLSEALRRAETARDAALKQSAGWEIQAQDMRDRLVRAEAERDAQHEQVLRLTGELEALATKTGDVEWREDAAVKVVKMRGRQIAELTATRDLLTAENERLQQEHNAYCRKLANDGLTVAGRLQRELDAVRAENDTLHYLLRGGQ